VNDQPVASPALADALKAAAGSQADPVVVIQADGKAPHQAVVSVMEAARQSSLSKLTFATQAPAH
jgi:biopolymer transport protein ExbD